MTNRVSVVTELPLAVLSVPLRPDADRSTLYATRTAFFAVSAQLQQAELGIVSAPGALRADYSAAAGEHLSFRGETKLLAQLAIFGARYMVQPRSAPLRAEFAEVVAGCELAAMASNPDGAWKYALVGRRRAMTRDILIAVGEMLDERRLPYALLGELLLAISFQCNKDLPKSRMFEAVAARYCGPRLEPADGSDPTPILRRGSANARAALREFLTLVARA